MSAKMSDDDDFDFDEQLYLHILEFYQQHLHRASQQQLAILAQMKDFIYNGTAFALPPEPPPPPTKARRTLRSSGATS